MTNFLKKQKTKPIYFNDGWCFAIVNGRLAEIFFKRKLGVWGHCYVERATYSKKERRMIEADINKFQFAYWNGRYRDKLNGFIFQTPSRYEIFPELKKHAKKINRHFTI